MIIRWQQPFLINICSCFFICLKILTKSDYLKIVEMTKFKNTISDYKLIFRKSVFKKVPFE